MVVFTKLFLITRGKPSCQGEEYAAAAEVLSTVAFQNFYIEHSHLIMYQ